MAEKKPKQHKIVPKEHSLKNARRVHFNYPRRGVDQSHKYTYFSASNLILCSFLSSWPSVLMRLAVMDEADTELKSIKLVLASTSEQG